jgi:hypothetical protein
MEKNCYRPCSATPWSIVQYLLPTNVTTFTPQFYCASQAGTVTQCGGSGACPFGCNDVTKMTDNVTQTLWDSVGAGVGQRHSVDFYFDLAVTAARLMTSVAIWPTSSPNRAQWQVRVADAIGGPYTVVQDFPTSLRTWFKEMTFFRQPNVGPRRVWSFIMDGTGGQMYLDEAYFTAIFCPVGFRMLDMGLCAACAPGRTGRPSARRWGRARGALLGRIQPARRRALRLASCAARGPSRRASVQAVARRAPPGHTRPAQDQRRACHAALALSPAAPNSTCAACAAGSCSSTACAS